MKLTRQKICIDIGQEAIRIGNIKDGILLSDSNEKLFVPSSTVVKPKQAKEQRHVLSSFEETYTHGQVVDREGFAGYMRTLLISLDRKPLPFVGGTVLLSVAATSSQTYKECLQDIFSDLGFSKVVFCPAPLAAAVGAGFSLPLKHAVLVVHIGSTSGEIALLTFSSAKTSTATVLTGELLAKTIIHGMYSQFHLKVSQKEARKILSGLESHVFQAPSDPRLTLDAFPQISKRYAQVPLTAFQCILQPVMETLYAEIALFLQELSTTQLSSIADHGILLSGGMGGMSGLAEECAKRLQLPVFSLPRSEDLVISGLLKLLDSCD